MTEKLTCPDCGSDKVTVAHIQTFMANSGEHYCHSTKTHDSDSPAYCIECEWRGERSNLVAFVPKKATKAVKYLLCPGEVRSRTDGDWHYIGARQLAHLYGVSMEDCVVLPDPEPGALGGGLRRHEFLLRADEGEFIALWPRLSGNYKLPEPRR